MSYEELQETLLRNIKRVKKERKLTIADLSRKIGISKVTISYILSGRRSISMYTLYALANGLNIDIRKLFDE